MIKYGDNEISKIYYGDQAISKICFGDVTIWGELPEGFPYPNYPCIIIGSDINLITTMSVIIDGLSTRANSMIEYDGQTFYVFDCSANPTPYFKVYAKGSGGGSN